MALSKTASVEKAIEILGETKEKLYRIKSKNINWGIESFCKNIEESIIELEEELELEN